MPSLTKKDFQMVAGVLHRVRENIRRADEVDGGQSWGGIEFDNYVVPLIADDLGRTNPAFDRQRFINAVETGKETT
jgi:hypothetical protein